jgi:uncharacterized membrane protein YfcA
MGMDYTTAELFWIALSILLLGMAKGGFPVGSIALPVIVLAWPDETAAARGAVAFMLPMLCIMDVFAVGFYRRQIEWRRIVPLFPGMLIGVALASILFVSPNNPTLSVSDRGLKLLIGLIGLGFTAYQFYRTRILARIEAHQPGRLLQWVYGLGTGVTSTVAHAAGPVMQMYLLPQHLPKLRFAGTNAAFFLVLNLVKVLPFWMLGRFSHDGLALGVKLLPVIPVGVLLGYGLVRLVPQKFYQRFLYIVLGVTSALLVLKALGPR